MTSSWLSPSTQLGVSLTAPVRAWGGRGRPKLPGVAASERWPDTMRPEPDTVHWPVIQACPQFLSSNCGLGKARAPRAGGRRPVPTWFQALTISPALVPQGRVPDPLSWSPTGTPHLTRHWRSNEKQSHYPEHCPPPRALANSCSSISTLLRSHCQSWKGRDKCLSLHDPRGPAQVLRKCFWT